MGNVRLLTDRELAMNLQLEGGRLSKEQAKAVANDFRLVDSDHDGYLTQHEAGVLFRALGQTVTDEELAKFLQDDPSDKIDFDTFTRFFQDHYRQPTTEDVLLQAFRVFDLSDSGVMSVKKLKEVLASLGEPMPSAEVDHVVRMAEIDDRGLFEYRKLVSRLCLSVEEREAP